MSGEKRKVSKKPSKVYWDACLFLAWFQNEPRAKEEMDELARQQNFFDAGRLHLCTSTITIVEVLEGTLPTTAVDDWHKVMQRDNFHLEQVTRRVCTKAHEIRDYYRGCGDGYGTFTTPDAIHLATAIVAGCDYLLSFDGSDGKPRIRGNRTILPAAGTLETRFSLKVVRPWLDPDPNKNLAFEFGEDSEEEEEGEGA
ncbi:MAG TPA: PIN domain-containing protein [Chthonomonadaceae bacterium]|nr:PIN domain-containing protein [Chthonomonadaceae bacterium]